ncbi:hypothetical protein PBCV1_a611R [Paramecium bursaria Chlorella virus 1]|uniref:Uncharacterized protein n=1 Tax=Paramecium bursaria Chlorella virus 1 TaxID=10506 RepID=O41093_PBCV1|nr:hypothetical protein PBCV1_a611R [Paramecium bursaria Chlorella virus 1]AAC97024.1 hypothetical protein [Paramecium bursaria Chlorella virus 1]
MGLCIFDHVPNDVFHRFRVKIPSNHVIVSRGCDDDKFGVFVCKNLVSRRGQVQVFRFEKLFDFLVLDWTLLVLD